MMDIENLLKFCTYKSNFRNYYVHEHRAHVAANVKNDLIKAPDASYSGRKL
jgi:hypothetical protein